MDDRLQDLANQGADITVKLRRQNAFVQIRIDGNTYKGTGGTLEKATTRAMEAYQNKTSSIKKERREKAAFRDELLDYGL